MQEKKKVVDHHGNLWRCHEMNRKKFIIIGDAKESGGISALHEILQRGRVFETNISSSE
jgi:hypothetical protein